MALLQKLEEFVEAQEQYVEMDVTFPRCEWSDHKREETFYLSVSYWTQTYKLLCSLVLSSPGDKSFAELVQVLKGYYNIEP